MKSIKIILLVLSLIVFNLHKTTHAVPAIEHKNDTDLEGTKGIFNTSLDLATTLALLNNTSPSFIPKLRKVTPVDNDSLERKFKNGAGSAGHKNVNTTTLAPPKVSKILTEAGALDINNASKNSTKVIETKIEDTKSDKTLKNNPNEVDKPEKISNKTATTTSSALNTTTTTKPIILTNNTVISAVNATLTASDKNITISKSSTAVSITTSLSTTPTTTTTTTTTTPKPKKPTITYGMPDFPDLEKDNPELKHLLQSAVPNKSPPDVPYAQPSQEYNGSLHRGRDFILPIVSMIFIIPLVIGILITSYRRFRDCWSTRHYRRMDFLVDGMYND